MARHSALRPGPPETNLKFSHLRSLIALVAAAGAIAGDNSVYWLGQHGGARLVRRYGQWVRLDARKLKVGRYLFARHGRKIVFFGRLITTLRTSAASSPD